MIRQWEILNAPSEKDPKRCRLSLWADGPDVARLRGAYADRVGSVWVPKRKPYNCAFFMYGLADGEKRELEDILSGKAALPEPPRPSVPAQKAREDLTGEDTQEILLREIHAHEGDAASSGIGAGAGGRRIGIGYFVPENLPLAADQAHRFLSRTMAEKKISVVFEKRFVLAYSGPEGQEIQKLFREAEAHAADCVVAVGDNGALQGLEAQGRQKKIFVKCVPEAVLDGNFWLTAIAEIVSFE